MNSKLKSLCVLAGVASFILCAYGAKAMYAGALADKVAIASFMLGVGVFSFFAMIGLASISSSVTTDNKVAQPAKTNLKSQPTKQVNKKATSGAPVSNKPVVKTEPLKREPETKDSRSQRPARIHVANLADSVGEIELREEFGVFGEVKNVRIISDRETGKPKGYAFIEMANREDAKLAIDDIDGQEIKGQEVKASFARPRPRRNGYRNQKRKSV